MLAALRQRHITFGLMFLAALAVFAGCSRDTGSEKIIVQGASGQLGTLVVDELLAMQIPAENLILVSRTPDKLARYAALGAATRYGDFTEPESLRQAYAGGTRMLLISMGGGGGRRAQLHAGAIDAAIAAGVAHIAYTSYVNAEEFTSSVIAPDHRATERYLRDSGIAWTMLRNSIYMNDLVNDAESAVRSGEIVTSAPDTRVGYVMREDCAAAAAAVIAKPGHENRVYDITGPELVGPRDIAAAAAAVAGVAVDYRELSEAEHVAELVAAGQSEQAARGALGFQSELSSPYLRVVSTAVEELTGRPPMSLRALLERNAERLRAAVNQP